MASPDGEPAPEAAPHDLAYWARIIGGLVAATAVVGDTVTRVAENFVTPDQLPWLQATDTNFIYIGLAGLVLAGYGKFEQWHASRSGNQPTTPIDGGES